MIDDFLPPQRQVKPAPEQKPPAENTREAAEQPEGEATPEAPAALPLPGTASEPSAKASGRPWWKLAWPPHRKEYITMALIILLAVSGGASWVLTHRAGPPVAAEKVTPIVKKPAPPPPKPLTSTLTGLPITDASVNARPVTGVMVENSLDARPQSGLSQAGVVFEAIAEGGITRFLALYQDQQPGNVGPIRSVRPYFLQWDMGFDAPIAHVGGSPEAMQDINDWGVKNLDQFYNSGSYHRISSRPAPHNVYTGVTTLAQLETAKGFTGSNYTGFSRKPDAPAATPAAGSIDFNISGYYYNVHYDYDKATNSYKRSEGGKPHIDADTNAQLSPKVVIALVLSYNLEADNKHSVYGTIGSGQAFIFQDGNLTQATWSKADAASQISFKDTDGKEVPLNAGQTWISVVSDPGKVVYKP